MQEIKKRRIVLASILKPVNDTRMFEKMGVSLARSGLYEVHLIGYPDATRVGEPNIHFHLLSPFKRISLERIVARLHALKLVIKVKPELLIVTTHELLGVAVLIRILFGAKVIYDIQENYWRNILYTNAFPKLIRPAIAFLVRLKEWVTSPFFTQFFIAEKCYAHELGFIKNKFLVIENKCRVPNGFSRTPHEDFIELIFTGTLAESTGVFQAIELSKKLQAQESKIQLTIIGYCAQPKVLARIEKEVFKNTFIRFIGGNELVPHTEIMNAIARANFGIVCYQLSQHTKNKIPTKLFEYLACGLPVLLQNHKPWIEMCASFDAAIPVNFEQPEIKPILDQISSKCFYSTASSIDSVTWRSEEKALLKLVRSIF